MKLRAYLVDDEPLALERLSRLLGVETPIHRFITTVLAPHVQGIQKRIERAEALDHLVHT